MMTVTPAQHVTHLVAIAAAMYAHARVVAERECDRNCHRMCTVHACDLALDYHLKDMVESLSDLQAGELAQLEMAGAA